MGLMISVVISYAGINEAIECISHLLAGVVPNTEPDFRDLVEYYTMLLQKQSNPSLPADWTRECGQGYLSLTEDKNGKLKSVAVKYYEEPRDSTAILFSTKISSFGQDSVDSISSQANGDYRIDRYTPTRTKTISSNTSESITVGNRNRSPTPREIISNSIRTPENSFERDENDAEEVNEVKEKLTWHYRPLSPAPQELPEIHFQSYDNDKKEDDQVYSEDFLRSLDGIKFRPLQRSDPSGRRRSFRKRHSSSSSSKESRASREEELKMFTSLEEAEFKRMNSDANVGVFGSTPNLSARSYSRSRSREKSNEGRNEVWSVEGSFGSVDDEQNSDLKPRLKDIPKLDSFEEEKEEAKQTEATVKEEEEDEVDFWANTCD